MTLQVFSTQSLFFGAQLIHSPDIFFRHFMVNSIECFDAVIKFVQSLQQILWPQLMLFHKKLQRSVQYILCEGHCTIVAPLFTPCQVF